MPHHSLCEGSQTVRYQDLTRRILHSAHNLAWGQGVAMVMVVVMVVMVGYCL
jgi:hypothetical protein